MNLHIEQTEAAMAQVERARLALIEAERQLNRVTIAVRNRWKINDDAAAGAVWSRCESALSHIDAMNAKRRLCADRITDVRNMLCTMRNGGAQ